VGVVPVDLDVGPLGLQAGDHRVRGADRLQIALQQNGRSAIVAHLPGRHFNFNHADVPAPAPRCQMRSDARRDGEAASQAASLSTGHTDLHGWPGGQGARTGALLEDDCLK